MKLSSGTLLLASPLLLDPLFYQTVVFLVSHDETGSFGLILNRPNPFTMAQGLGSVCPQLLEDSLLFSGGPVEPQSFFCLHNNGMTEKDDGDTFVSNIGNFENTQKIISGVYIGAESSVLDAYAFDNPDSQFKARFFNGYTGWGSAQLDGEIEEGSWIIHNAHPSSIFHEDHSTHWEYLMTNKSPNARAPEQPWDSSKYN